MGEYFLLMELLSNEVEKGLKVIGLVYQGTCKCTHLPMHTIGMYIITCSGSPSLVPMPFHLTRDHLQSRDCK